MKKIFFLFISMMMTVCAMAQMPQFDPEQMVKMQMDEMKKQCNLNDDQYKTVYELQLASTKQMFHEVDSVQKAGGDMFQAFDMQKMQKRAEELNAKIKAVLTEEQYKAYEKLQADRRKRFQGGGF